MIDIKQFKVKPGKAVVLKDWPTRIPDVYASKADYTRMLADHVTKLSELQQRLYASNAYSILIIFQGMDAAGKDGVIKHVMSGINPQGCMVHSFKQPSREELDHDFLWRTVARLPERGDIGIFNRSYYEEVLVTRVHPQILAGQGIPDLPDKPARIWKQRFDSINDFEQHLHRNGTRIIKFYLHMSKEEQRQRFLQRIDDPQKNWKFNLDDIKERAFWPKYMKAYEACMSETSSAEAPWHIVPADDKENARLIISQTVVRVLEKLDLHYPTTAGEKHAELMEIKRQLQEQK